MCVSGGDGVGISGEGRQFELENAVRKEVGVVVDNVEPSDVCTGLRVGDDEVSTGASFGVVGQTCGFVVLDGAILGGMGTDVDPVLLVNELEKCRETMGVGVEVAGDEGVGKSKYM